MGNIYWFGCVFVGYWDFYFKKTIAKQIRVFSSALFAKYLVMEYMNAILSDELLLKIEGSERFMMKISEEVLLEEREEGR